MITITTIPISHHFNYTRMSQPLLTFNHAGIELDKAIAGSLQYKHKVITMMGKARTGKSTFLNLLVNYLSDDTRAIFESNQSIEHCTHGVNVFQTRNMTLMDCQGLEYQDSHNDVDLSLFAYMVSNVMIFNCSAIDNSTLKSMEPIVSFANRIGGTAASSKPTLVFRVRDYGLDAPAEQMLHKTMQPHDDQYQTIRDGLHHLFDPIIAVATLHLDRTELGQLKQHQYTEFLQQDNGYEACFDTIMTNISDAGQHVTRQYLAGVVETIQHKSIDAKQLDVSLLIIKNNLGEFINRVDKSIYQEIPTDGTKKVFDEAITPRMDFLSTTLATFDAEFDKVELSLKQPYRQQIVDSVQPVIDSAMENNNDKATTLLEPFHQFLHNRLGLFANELAEADHVDYKQVLSKYKNLKFATMVDLDTYNHVHPATYRQLIKLVDTFWEKSSSDIEDINAKNALAINDVVKKTLAHTASIDVAWMLEKLDAMGSWAITVNYSIPCKWRRKVVFDTVVGECHKEITTIVADMHYDAIIFQRQSLYARYSPHSWADIVATNYSPTHTRKEAVDTIDGECHKEISTIVADMHYDAIIFQDHELKSEQRTICGTYEFNDVQQYMDGIDWQSLWAHPTVVKRYLEMKAAMLKDHLSTQATIDPVVIDNNPEFTFYHFSFTGPTAELGEYWYKEIFQRPSKTFLKLDSIDIDEIQDALDGQNVATDHAINGSKLEEIFGKQSKYNQINIVMGSSIPHTIILESLVKKLLETKYEIAL